MTGSLIASVADGVPATAKDGRLDLQVLPVPVLVLEWRDERPVIAEANREAEQLLGRRLPVGEAVIPILAAAGARHPAQEVLRRADVLGGFLGNGRVRLDELMWVDGEGGDQRAVRLTLARLPDPRFLRVMVVMEDVTDLTHLQRSHDAFAAAISHELRTPLASVRGIAELMGMQLDDLSTEELAEGIDRILARTEDLTRIVDQLLDFTRIGLGLFEVELGPVDLRETARAVAVRRTDVEVEVDVDPLADHVLTDRRLLERVLDLLLENALRHGAPPYAVRTRPRGAGLTVAVVDHGPGIPAEERRRLFVPFMKQRLGTGDGAGLGLALVRVLASAMGGEVGYQELPDGGSSVWIGFGREYG